MRRPDRVEVRIHRRIADVDPRLWDQPLDAGDLQASHRFVSACEAAGLEDAEYRHILLVEEGRVLATASLFRMQVALELLAGTAVRRGVRAVRRLAPGFLRMPVLFCGLPVSFGGSCLRVAAGADPALAAAAVSDALSAFARDTDTPFQCIKELSPEEEARVAPPLRAHGFWSAPSIPFCWLPIRWSSWPAYVADMRAPFRRQLQSAARRLQQAGGRIRRVDDYRGDAARIFRLYRDVMDRAPYQLEQLNERFFLTLKENFGASARAVVVERGSELLAVAIVLESARELTFLIAGIDYAHNRATSAYLALCAEMVAEAIRTGKARVALGQTSYYIKGRLGALTSPRRILIRHARPTTQRLLRATSRWLFPDRQYPALPVFKAARGDSQ
jgi:predicted N-acyltransferase